MNGEEKIGLFGGTFDPIHTGHLILAEVASDFVGLDRVLFIPTSFPPNKRDVELTDFETRNRMVKLAIADNPRFELSLVEECDEVAYTYKTVLRFRDQGFDRERLHLLIGSDSLEEMLTWKNPDVIFSNATVVAFKRPGHERMPVVPDGAAVIMIGTGCNAISASEIRELVSEGRSIRYLVPDVIERFIIDHSLYHETA